MNLCISVDFTVSYTNALASDSDGGFNDTDYSQQGILHKVC